MSAVAAFAYARHLIIVSVVAVIVFARHLIIVTGGHSDSCAVDCRCTCGIMSHYQHGCTTAI